MRLFRQSSIGPLPVSIAGLKLGDRLLVLGCGDPTLIAQLAQKTGLTGRACALDADQARAARAANLVEREGALVETLTAPWTALPLDAESFDVVVARDVFVTLETSQRSGALREALRVLRPGGRCLVVESAPKSGLAALVSRRTADASYRAEEALAEAGFRAVRTVAEREGMVFAEGVKENR